MVSIDIRNQSKQRRLVRKEPDNWPTKARRPGWRIVDQSTNIHSTLLIAVDTCTHWVPIFFSFWTPGVSRQTQYKVMIHYLTLICRGLPLDRRDKAAVEVIHWTTCSVILYNSTAGFWTVRLQDVSIFRFLLVVLHVMQLLCVLLYSVPTLTVKLTLRHIIIGLHEVPRRPFLQIPPQIVSLYYLLFFASIISFLRFLTLLCVLFNCWQNWEEIKWKESYQFALFAE